MILSIDHRSHQSIKLSSLNSSFVSLALTAIYIISYANLGWIFHSESLTILQRVVIPLLLIYIYVILYNQFVFGILYLGYLSLFLILGYDAREVFQDVTMIALCLTSFYFIKDFVITKMDGKKIFYVLLLILFWTYFYNYLQLRQIYDNLNRISGSLNPNLFSFSLSLFIFSGLHFVENKGNKLKLIIILLGASAVLLSGSRGGIIFFILLFSFHVFAFNVVSKKQFFFSVLLIFTLLVFIIGSNNRIVQLLMENNIGTLKFRIKLWSIMWDIVRRENFFEWFAGIDKNMTMDALSRANLYFRGSFHYDKYRIFHNDLMRIFILYGFIGSFSTIFTLFRFFKYNKLPIFNLQYLILLLPFSYENVFADSGLSISFSYSLYFASIYYLRKNTIS